jgi:hypothetical protein
VRARARIGGCSRSGRAGWLADHARQRRSGNRECARQYRRVPGGIGYQAGKLAFAAFAGRLYANQTLPTRAASTRANGTFVGGMVSFANRGLDLGGSVTWDDSSATTRRTLFDASTVTGDYALHTLTLDAHGGYGLHWAGAVGGSARNWGSRISA